MFSDKLRKLRDSFRANEEAKGKKYNTDEYFENVIKPHFEKFFPKEQILKDFKRVVELEASQGSAQFVYRQKNFVPHLPWPDRDTCAYAKHEQLKRSEEYWIKLMDDLFTFMKETFEKDKGLVVWVQPNTPHCFILTLKET